MDHQLYEDFEQCVQTGQTSVTLLKQQHVTYTMYYLPNTLSQEQRKVK